MLRPLFPQRAGEYSIPEFSEKPRPDEASARHSPVGMPTLPAERVSCEAPARGLSDRELVARFLETREEGSFAEIVARHGNLVMAVAWRVLRDRHAAEDAFQATFLVLAEHVRAIRHRESLAAWLYGTAFRVARKAFATHKRRRECVMPVEPTCEPPGDQTARQEQQLILDEELSRLPESVRGPLVLHYLQEKSAPEIAEELGMSLAAVEGRLKRGRKTLRTRLLRRGVLLSAVIASVELSASSVTAAVTAPLIQLTAQACTASALSAPLPALVSFTATQLAARELIAMSKIALMKSALLWGGVAGVMTLSGFAATGDWLGQAAAQSDGGAGTGAAGAAPSGLVDESANELPAGGIVTTGAEVAPGGSGGEIVQAGLSGAGEGSEGSGFGVLVGAGGGAPAVGTTTGDGRVVNENPAAGAGAPMGPGAGAPPGFAGSGQFGGAYGGGQGGGAAGMSGGPAGMPGAMMGMGGAGMMGPGPQSRVVDYRRQSPNEQRIHQAFGEPVNLQFVGQTLEGVLQILETDFNFTIRLDTAALSDSGVGPETEMTLVIKGVSLESALETLLENVNGVELDYVIENEVLKITTAEKAREAIETRVYDVRDFGTLTPAILSRVIERTVEPQSWMASVAEGRRDSQSGGGQSSGGYPGAGGTGPGMASGGSAMGRSSGMAGPMSAMMAMGGGGRGQSSGSMPGGGQETPGPDVARDQGRGWIEAIDGALVITQSQPVHREIVALLEQLSDHARAGQAGSPMGMGMMPGMPGMGSMSPGAGYSAGGGDAGSGGYGASGIGPAGGGLGAPSGSGFGQGPTGAGGGPPGFNPIGGDSFRPGAANVPGSGGAAPPGGNPAGGAPASSQPSR